MTSCGKLSFPRDRSAPTYRSVRGCKALRARLPQGHFPLAPVSVRLRAIGRYLRSKPVGMAAIRSSISQTPLTATATLTVETAGEGFVDITREGALFLFIRHTSASLTIQENADPDVQTDLVTALRRIAPSNVPWVHDTEGPDDMPAHVKAMVTGTSLHVPVIGGALALGTWQGVYVAEHRSRPHRREVVMQFVGARG